MTEMPAPALSETGPARQLVRPGRGPPATVPQLAQPIL